MEDDIYDDGSNIRNATAVSRMRSLFEAPAADTRPLKTVPKQIMRPIPGAVNRVPSPLVPKEDKAEDAGKTANGMADESEKPTDKTSELSTWKNRVEMFNKQQVPSVPVKPVKTVPEKSSPDEKKDENSNTVSNNSGKRSSKLNIPAAFSGANSTPPPVTPKKPLVFTKPAEKSETKPGDQSSPVKPKPIVPSRGKNPAVGSSNIHEELQRKFSGKEDDIKPNKTVIGQKDPVRPGKLNMASVLALQEKISGSGTSEESNDKVQMRRKSGSKFPNRRSVKRKSLTRTNDGSKFYLVEVSIDDNTEKNNDKEPDIPPPLVYSDLQRLQEIIQEYKSALRELEGYPTDDNGIIEEIEDVYEAIPADMDEPPSLPSHKKLSRAVSLIKPMSENDEYDSDEQDTYDDTVNYIHKDLSSNSLPAPPDLDLPAPPDELLRPPVPEGPIPSRRKPSFPVPPERPADTTTPLVPQADDWPDDVYDDCSTEQSQDQSTAEAELEQDDVYEAIPGEGENPPPPPTPERQEEKKEEKKDEKLSAKEKKKRDKEEAEKMKVEKRKQEAEKKRQEKELKEIKKNFKIDASLLDKSQGEGMLKEDAVPSGGKTAKLELTAKKGAFLKVIRLVDNPPGKWLVRLTEDEKSDKPVYLPQIVGYVDANIVEVDNQLIRNVMTGSLVNTLNNVGDGEEYQDVECGGPPVEDELYEAM
ncbi:FYN-binding protein 1-like isoform X2 [Pecten maximus]|uniref:FYN-binding protein 1-like isoform X2 n=1 Tax=Pecten maximus TaxID=6579 RepID=UPI001458B35A|nr:FYN-binding protein 1-like isoform X2 [Pecten maximus]